MREAAEHDVAEAVDLLVGCGVERGVAVAVDAHHHEAIASTTSWHEPSGDLRVSRTPEAPSTAYGSGPSSGA